MLPTTYGRMCCATSPGAHFTGSARAEDIWTEPFPGVRYLKRSEPHRIYHVITVQLSHRDLSVRATDPDERGRTTVAFAKLVNAAVAVNGDAFSTPGFIPRGRATGDGRAWPRQGPVPTDQAFIACNANRVCMIDEARGDRAPGAEWTNVVGGDGALLTFKAAPPGERAYKVRLEDESAVDDPDAVERILLGLGFRPGFRFRLLFQGQFRFGFFLVRCIIKPGQGHAAEKKFQYCQG